LQLERALFDLCTLARPALADDVADTRPNIVAASRTPPTRSRYLDFIAKTREGPDFSHPRVSNPLARVFDFQGLAALPSPTAKDVSWLP
jgi:hypothetical protein